MRFVRRRISWMKITERCLVQEFVFVIDSFKWTECLTNKSQSRRVPCSAVLFQATQTQNSSRAIFYDWNQTITNTKLYNADKEIPIKRRHIFVTLNGAALLKSTFDPFEKVKSFQQIQWKRKWNSESMLNHGSLELHFVTNFQNIHRIFCCAHLEQWKQKVWTKVQSKKQEIKSPRIWEHQIELEPSLANLCFDSFGILSKWEQQITNSNKANFVIENKCKTTWNKRKNWCTEGEGTTTKICRIEFEYEMK